MCGPNTVESLDLILDCARHASSLGCSFLRGGAYKPLTFPYRSDKYFEPRSSGVKWLAQAKAETNIRIVTEIVHESHLDEMKDAVDMLQIGTRNMQNFPLLACAKSASLFF